MKCKSISSQLPDNSSLTPLLEGLHKSGVSDASIDAGFYQMDYAAPRSRGWFEGAGDCKIEEREVAEAALADWRRFREPLMAWHGSRLPWDYDPAPLKGDEESRAKYLVEFDALAKEVIASVRADLAKKGLAPDSDEYRDAMASALYWFVEFPEADDWRRYGRTQRKEVLSAMKRLDRLGLKNLKRLLEEKGGCGNFYLYAAEAHAINHYGFNLMVVPDMQSPKLYYLFEMAGLKPSFVEIVNMNAKDYRCGLQMPISIGVGFEQKSGWRAFDSTMHNPDAEKLVFYPMSLRQHLVSRSSGKAMMDTMFTGRMEKDDLAKFLSADGAAVSINVMMGAIAALKQGEPVSSAEGSRQITEFFRKNKRLIHPVVGGIVAYLSRYAGGIEAEYMNAIADAVDMRGIVPQEYLSTIIVGMHTISAGDVVGDMIAAENAGFLLTVDPACHIAHRSLAEAGAAQPEKYSGAEVRRHFAMSMKGVEFNKEERGEVLLKWGWYELQTGREGRARDLLKRVEADRDFSEGDRTVAGWLLGIMAARAGDISEAASRMKIASEKIARDLAGTDKPNYVKEWARIADGQIARLPLSPRALESEEVKAPHVQTLFFLAKLCLSEKKYDMAIRIGTAAVEMLKSVDRMPGLCWLHEAYMQAGDLEAAKKVWVRIRELMERGVVGSE